MEASAEGGGGSGGGGSEGRVSEESSSDVDGGERVTSKERIAEESDESGDGSGGDGSEGSVSEESSEWGGDKETSEGINGSGCRLSADGYIGRKGGNVGADSNRRCG